MSSFNGFVYTTECGQIPNVCFRNVLGFFFRAILKRSTSVLMVASCALDIHSLKSHSIRRSRQRLSKAIP